MDESSFPGASCPNDEEAGFAFSSASFVSFSDDLQTLQGSVEMVGDDMGQPGELDLFGNTGPLLTAECNSVCSFTTVATEDLQGKQQSTRTPEIASVEGTGGDTALVNLDAALNVAFNSFSKCGKPESGSTFLVMRILDLITAFGASHCKGLHLPSGGWTMKF